MKPHKWAKEIIAWANGAKIEMYKGLNDDIWDDEPYPDWNHTVLKFRIKSQPKEDIIKMTCCFCGQVIPYNTYHACTTEHNVKPQPKEPQYLYAYFDYKKLAINWSISGGNTGQGDYIGKIKLEVNDEE